MRDGIDFDAGPAMSHADQLTYGTALFEALVDMASGAESKSEALGFGTEEIVPWRRGAVLQKVNHALGTGRAASRSPLRGAALPG